MNYSNLFFGFFINTLNVTQKVNNNVNVKNTKMVINNGYNNFLYKALNGFQCKAINFLINSNNKNNL